MQTDPKDTGLEERMRTGFDVEEEEINDELHAELEAIPDNKGFATFNKQGVSL